MISPLPDAKTATKISLRSAMHFCPAKPSIVSIAYSYHLAPSFPPIPLLTSWGGN